jgi:hypothetical protein
MPITKVSFHVVDGGRRVGFGRGEFAERSFARFQYEYEGNDRSFRSQRS